MPAYKKEARKDMKQEKRQRAARDTTAPNAPRGKAPIKATKTKKSR